MGTPLRVAIGLLGLGGALSGGACNTASCDTSIRPSLIAEVRDSVSDAPIAAGALAIATVDTVTDTLVPYEITIAGQILSLATRGERAGSYRLTVAQSGYQLWNRDTLVVHQGGCHTSQLRVRVRLRP